nr:hypothetical protein [uncultured Duganella sp.]
MKTTDHVLEILVKEGGYRKLPTPFKVGAIPFEFTHALVAGERANDLVVVIEVSGDTIDDGVTRKILALTRALDVMGSKRPVTAVLTLGQPRTETIHSISRVCRVLPIGAPIGPNAAEAVRDWLSVLLPLIQQPPMETMLNWTVDLSASVPTLTGNEFAKSVIEAAPRGKTAVEEVLADAITRSVDAATADEGDEE